MVELEILTSSLRQGHEAEWLPLARLRVDGHEVQVEGEQHAIDFTIPVISLRTGQQVCFDDDHEEWARSLPTAFRTGDVVVRVLHDDDPIREDEVAGLEVERHEVHLREQLGHRV